MGLLVPDGGYRRCDWPPDLIRVALGRRIADRQRPARMTNSIALWLGALLLGGILLDTLVFDGATLVALGRSFFSLIEWLRFWG